MKATEANFLEFIKKSPQFVIPIYQRTYSWTERECSQLWGDVLRAGAAENISAHFIGSVVYIQDGLFHVMSPSSLLVIDGQQRLTTITLLIAALAEAIEALFQTKSGCCSISESLLSDQVSLIFRHYLDYWTPLLKKPMESGL